MDGGTDVQAWRPEALAAGFDLDELALIADFVAGGVVTVDGPPIEVLPGYWVIPGFLPYDGLVILATVDRKRARDDVDQGPAWDVILERAVAASGGGSAVTVRGADGPAGTG